MKIYFIITSSHYDELHFSESIIMSWNPGHETERIYLKLDNIKTTQQFLSCFEIFELNIKIKTKTITHQNIGLNPRAPSPRSFLLFETDNCWGDWAIWRAHSVSTL